MLPTSAASVRDPFLFLDVDGVINVLPRSTPAPDPTAKIEGCPIWIPEGVEDRVRTLAEHFEVWWCTAWREGDARQIFPFGAEWPSVEWGIHAVRARVRKPFDVLKPENLSLKLPAILALAKARRWAWVDDDALWELGQLALRERRLTLPPHHHAHIATPSTWKGLEDSHVEQLLEWKDQGGDAYSTRDNSRS